MNSVKGNEKYRVRSNSGNSKNSPSEKNGSAESASRAVKVCEETTSHQREMRGNTRFKGGCSRNDVSGAIPKAKINRGNTSTSSTPKAKFPFSIKEIFFRGILNKALKSIPDNVKFSDKKCPDGFLKDKQKVFYDTHKKKLVESMVLFGRHAAKMYKAARNGINESVSSSVQAPEIAIGYVQYKHSKFMIELENVKVTLQSIILSKDRPKDISLGFCAQAELKVSGKVKANTHQDIAAQGFLSLEEMLRQWKIEDEGGADGCNTGDERKERPLTLAAKMQTSDIRVKLDSEMEETQYVHNFLKGDLVSISQGMKRLASLIKGVSSKENINCEVFLDNIAIKIAFLSIDWCFSASERLRTKKAGIEVFDACFGYQNNQTEVDRNPVSQVTNSLIEQYVNIDAVHVSMPGKVKELLTIDDGFCELLAIITYNFLSGAKGVDENLLSKIMPSFFAKRIVTFINEGTGGLSRLKKRVDIVMGIKEKAQAKIEKYNQCAEFLEVGLMEPENTSVHFENIAVGFKIEKVIDPRIYQCESETPSPSGASNKKGANVPRPNASKSLFRSSEVTGKIFKKKGEVKSSGKNSIPESESETKEKIEVSVNVKSASLTTNGNYAELSAIANNSFLRYCDDHTVTLQVGGDNQEGAGSNQHGDSFLAERVLVPTPKTSLSCMITSKSLESVLPFSGKVKVSSDSVLHLVKDTQKDFSNILQSRVLLKVESATDKTTIKSMHAVAEEVHSNATALDAESKCPTVRRIPKYTKAFIELPNNRAPETTESIDVDVQGLSQLAMAGLASLKQSADRILKF